MSIPVYICSITRERERYSGTILILALSLLMNRSYVQEKFHVNLGGLYVKESVVHFRFYLPRN